MKQRAHHSLLSALAFPSVLSPDILVNSVCLSFRLASSSRHYKPNRRRFVDYTGSFSMLEPGNGQMAG